MPVPAPHGSAGDAEAGGTVPPLGLEELKGGEELESRDWDGKGSVERGGDLGLKGAEGDRRSLVGRAEALPAVLGMGALLYMSVPFTSPGGRITRWKDELSSPCVSLTSLNLHFLNCKRG